MSGTNNFTIQKHDTTHPHYDFYLQIGGEVKSWIVPNGIPDNTKEKKIAVECESSYKTLPDAQSSNVIEDAYGTGKARVWDEGVCTLETNKNIKIILEASGKKFNGKYILHIPNWGRWTKRRLWTIEKIR